MILYGTNDLGRVARRSQPLLVRLAVDGLKSGVQAWGSMKVAARQDLNGARADDEAAGSRSTLGSRLRGWRLQHGLTLKQMSDRTGLPFSTLSKVEHDRLTLTYEKLHLISERLQISMSALFAEPEQPSLTTANSRRSLATRANALQVTTPIYDYFYMSPELRHKAMIPILSQIKARTLDEFGPLVRHRGEEFLYVLEGHVVVHTDFYDPVVLAAGEAVYIDSTMGHAYVLAEGCDVAMALCVCSTSQEELVSSATALNERGLGHPSREAKSGEAKPKRAKTGRQRPRD